MHTRQLGLDIFRSIAIICVIVAHNDEIFEHLFTRNTLSAMSYLGQWGVDFFFALSGFLIGRILIRSLTKYNNAAWIPNFLYRRWLKTLPLYYLALCLYAVAYGFPKDFFLYVFHVKGLVSWTDPIFFGASWSLFVEELFYLLCAICACTFYYKKTPVSPIPLLKFCLTVILIAVSFRMLFFIFSKDHKNLLNITIARLDAPIFGFIIAIIKEYYPLFFHQLEKHRYALLTFGILVILSTIIPRADILSITIAYIILFAFNALVIGFMLYFIGKKTALGHYFFKYINQKYQRFILLIVCLSIATFLFFMSVDSYSIYFSSIWSFDVASIASSLFLIYFATMPELNVGKNISAMIIFCSQSSYAVYLTHELVIKFCFAFIKETSKSFELTYCTLVALLSIILIYILCYFLVTFIEKPILAWRDRKFLL